MGNTINKTSERYNDTKILAKQKWINLQEPPSGIPSSWDEKIDANGDLYYVDRTNGELYRITPNKKHKRIDTNDKISLVQEMSRLRKESNLDEDSLAVSDTHKPSDHSKHSSTTFTQGWRCTQCTFENAGNQDQCQICNSSRPMADEDSDDSQSYKQRKPRRKPKNEEEEKQERHSPVQEINDSYVEPEDSHHRSTSYDSINEAINQSLLAMGNVEINKLTDSEKVALLSFIDFTDCEAEIAMDYLPTYNWDAKAAMEKYFEDKKHKRNQDQCQICNSSRTMAGLHMEDDLPMKQQSFKKYFYENVTKSTEVYYQAFVDNDYNELDILMQFDSSDLSVLVDECHMKRMHAKKLLNDIKLLKEKNEHFQQWLMEMDMKIKYYKKMTVAGIVTLSMLQETFMCVTDFVIFLGGKDDKEREMDGIFIWENACIPKNIKKNEKNNEESQTIGNIHINETAGYGSEGDEGIEPSLL